MILSADEDSAWDRGRSPPTCLDDIRRIYITWRTTIKLTIRKISARFDEVHEGMNVKRKICTIPRFHNLFLTWRAIYHENETSVAIYIFLAALYGYLVNGIMYTTVYSSMHMVQLLP